MAKYNIETIVTDSLLQPTAWFKEAAEKATADFLMFVGKESVSVDEALLDGMLHAMPEEAVMAYSHYRKKIDGNIVDAPTIGLQPGSLRNDFDFGPVVLFRVAALKRYYDGDVYEYTYAGFYQLRLAMERVGKIYHHPEYVYTVDEDDTRKSGEKQFDYVNPAQRSVQIEMEQACTRHLKAIKAWLLPCKYDRIDLRAGEFPFEASVVIPVLNRESTIADAITSVLKQKCSFAFNILVVDNHSTDGTPQIIDSFADERVVHIVPSRNDLGIGGCWQLAVDDVRCGRFAVQLDSDDIYSDENTLQRIVDGFYEQQCAMLIGSYRICDFELNTLPPGVIDHAEWTEENGRNNALRINGLGAPRAFFTPVIRGIGFPNVSYGEDYAVGLQISRRYRIGRIYDVLYLCRRWGGNSDAALSHEKVNAHNLYKDSLRTVELLARQELVKSWETMDSLGLQEFAYNQLALWPAVAKRYQELGGVKMRNLDNNLSLHCNPARSISVAAKVDAASIAERPCFLCAANRPAEQMAGDALGALELLVNPYPIMPYHFTLASKVHTPQLLMPMYADMLHLVGRWPGFALFYNGAKCGASAPDHAHLQAVPVERISLYWTLAREKFDLGDAAIGAEGGCVYNVKGYTVPFFLIKSRQISYSVALLGDLFAAMASVDGEDEPRVNVVVYSSTPNVLWSANDFYPYEYVTIVIPRSKHRPDCFFANDASQRLVSPGALDMVGHVVVPRECDFEAITCDEVVAMLREVAISPVEADSVFAKFRSLNEKN